MKVNIINIAYIFWWSQAGSNRRPPACKAGALPAELRPQKMKQRIMVGLGGFEPPTSPLSGVRSNQLSYRPMGSIKYINYFLICSDLMYTKCIH